MKICSLKILFLAGIVLVQSGCSQSISSGVNDIKKIGEEFASKQCDLFTQDSSSENAGDCDGYGNNARFQFLLGITHDLKGNLYIATHNMIRKISPDRLVTTIAGRPDVMESHDGVGGQATFAGIHNIIIDDKYLYANDFFGVIQMNLASQIVTRYAGIVHVVGIKNGQRLESEFTVPSVLTVDRFHNIYVSDNEFDDIRKISSFGLVNTLLPIQNPLAATSNYSQWNVSFSDMVTDNVGNLYVADIKNNVIRKVNPIGQMSVFAGALGESGAVDGRGTQARFFNPLGIAIDKYNNLYVADTYNRIIRKISPDGLVTTIAGKAGYYGSVDGVATNARFVYPNKLTVLDDGTIYVTDYDAQQIRKITPDGLVTTFAGKLGFSKSGQNKVVNGRWSDY